MDIKWVKISDILFFQEGPGVRNTQYTTEGVKLLNVSNFVDGKVYLSTSDRYISKEEAYGKYKHFLCDEGDFVVASSGIKVDYLDKKMGFIEKEMLPLCMNTSTIRFKVLEKEQLNIRYFMYYVKSQHYKNQVAFHITGSAQLNYGPSHLKKMVMPLISIEKQGKIVKVLDIVSGIIEARLQELQKLDDLVKARFVEMFGDLKTNSKGWQIVGFKDCANIDTNMIHDFDGYEDYPHIGIESIEKETGQLVGYRTILEDGVISGKYLFTPEHIIYSKIRPNLNKVALPDFHGLCSADAYPILVKSEVCNREYLGYTLRSKYFLDYILAFSNRTNLPKVNKNQVEGFKLPLPPIELQEQFAAFVAQVDKSKFDKHGNIYIKSKTKLKTATSPN